MSTVRLEGTDKLIMAIKKALINHKPSEVRKALKRGASLLVETAKGNIHHSVSGTLKNSIKILPVWSKDPAAGFVGPRVKRVSKAKKAQGVQVTDSPFYAHWVEYGTAAHSLGYKGKFVEVNGKKHPGSKPYPYMRPAHDQVGQQALDMAMEDMGKLIESKV